MKSLYVPPRYEVQRVHQGDYEIYTYRKDAEGIEQYLECYLCDGDGEVLGYEVWSDGLQEFIEVGLKNKKSEYYKKCFSEVKEYLLMAIENHKDSNGMAI